LRAERKQKEESAQKWPAKQHKNREPLSQYKKKFASEYNKKKTQTQTPQHHPIYELSALRVQIIKLNKLMVFVQKLTSCRQVRKTFDGHIIHRWIHT